MDKLNDKKTRLKDLMRKRRQTRAVDKPVRSAPAIVEEPAQSEKPVEPVERKPAPQAPTSVLTNLVGYGDVKSDSEEEESDAEQDETTGGELPAGFFDDSNIRQIEPPVDSPAAPTPEPQREELAGEQSTIDDELQFLEKAVQAEVQKAEKKKEQIVQQEEKDLDLDELHGDEEQKEVNQRFESLRQRAMEFAKRRKLEPDSKTPAATGTLPVKRDTDPASGDEEDDEDVDFDIDWRSKRL